jgi:hypothetical protein
LRKIRRRQFCRRLAAGQQSKPFNLTGDVFQSGGLGAVYRHAQGLQPIQQARRVAALPAHHQIRLELHDRFQIRAVVAPDFGQLLGRLREITVVHHPDDAVSGDGGEQVFRGMGGQADDAAGRLGQEHIGAGIVPCHHGSLCGKGTGAA